MAADHPRTLKEGRLINYNERWEGPKGSWESFNIHQSCGSRPVLEASEYMGDPRMSSQLYGHKKGQMYLTFPHVLLVQ